MSTTHSEKWQSNISLIASLLAIFMNISIGFFISPIIVKDLGVEANGFAQLANNFVSYATLLTTALNAMASRFVSVCYHKGEFQKAQSYYSSAMAGNLIITLVLIVPAILLIMNIDTVVSIQTTRVSDVKLLFLFVFSNFFLVNVSNVFNISTTVKNRHYLSSAITMLGSIIRIGILVVLFSIFEARVYYVSLAALVVSFVSFFEYLAVKNRLIPDVKFTMTDFKLSSIKELIFSGIWNTINKCGEILMTGFDLLLTNLFISSTSMGVMSVAKTIPTHLISIASTISWNWYPKMTREYAEGRKDKMFETLNYSAKLTSIITSLPIMIFCVFSKEFYSLWMPTQDATTLSVLSFLSIFSYMLLSGSSCVFNIFVIYNNLKVNSISFLCGAVVSIIASFICVKYTNYGIYAIAGISSIIVVIRNICFLLPYTAKYVGLKWYSFYKFVLLNALCSVIVGAIAYAVKKAFLPDSWFSFISACIIALFISLLMLWLVIVNKEQKQAMLRKFKAFRGKKNG